ncbi:MAG: methyltransferase domain-containing protein, partial [Myxococcota bacterium]|nr:methyltransferase domain-containing protein [Myxococcota bacterium]
MASRRPLLELLLLSMSALFLELAFIRWIPGSVRVAGYFTNMILIASFLGLGTGAILSRFRRDLFGWWPVTFFALALSTLVFGALGQSNPPGEAEFIWAGGPWHALDENIGWLWTLNSWLWSTVAGPLEGLSFYVVITALFVLTAALFTLLGHRVGELFAALPPLRAYGYDLGGSVLGILLFTLVSRMSAPPIAWFALGVGGLAILTNWRGVRGALSATVVLCGLILVLASSHSYHWSPYYKIEVSAVDENMAEGVAPVENPRALGFRVRVNNDYHQTALDLSPTAPDVPFIRDWRARYDAPYRHVTPGRVLVLGAGSGNDVQAALRNGASHVTAVEIDPALAALGRDTHPERPYADPRVSLVVDDARSYLKRSTETFDTIVYGFLDSHTLMTSFSTLRIDNYVYTVQGLTEAFERLNPGGHIALSFASVRPFLGS